MTVLLETLYEAGLKEERKRQGNREAVEHLDEDRSS